MSGDPTRLAVIGGGAMAEAILLGGVQAGVLTTPQIAVADPTPERRAFFAERGMATFEPGSGVIEWLGDGAGQVLLATKPQMLGGVVEAIEAPLGARGRTVVASILAGVPIRALAAKLGDSHAYIRLMPNTPAQVSRGLTALAPDDGVSSDETSLVRALFDALGEVFELQEPMIDAFTGVAGSGPAYLFYLAEAMSKGAEAVGFDSETARRLADGTVIGAAALLESSDATAAELRARVTSRKGTTAAAIGTLDDRGVMDAVRAAIEAARDRGVELGLDAGA